MRLTDEGYLKSTESLNSKLRSRTPRPGAALKQITSHEKSEPRNFEFELST